MTIKGILTTTASAAALVLILGSAPTLAADNAMGFFVSSTGVGDGANLGGLAGADAHCNKLATAAGSKGRTWKAYLSTWFPDKRGTSARDRIGKGPWHNAKGVLIASNLDDLHISPNLVKGTALDENGMMIKGRGDKPNQHDILTGTKADGTAYFPWEKGEHTCSNWTSNDKGSAMLGHHDRHGGGNVSWNTAHGSRGCSQKALASTGGAGYLYCFAAD
jgi:hypothetical protein